MGVKYLWDTNTAIYYLQQQFSLPAEKFMDEVTKESPPCISVITEIELLCWKTATPQDLAILHGFIQNAVVIELERPVKLKTADIRRNHKIKLPDAIIAATAVAYDLILITHNVADFKNIESIHVIDPFRVV
jgi:predicted nucleic acid-binding protein